MEPQQWTKNIVLVHSSAPKGGWPQNRSPRQTEWDGEALWKRGRATRSTRCQHPPIKKAGGYDNNRCKHSLKNGPESPPQYRDCGRGWGGVGAGPVGCTYARSTTPHLDWGSQAAQTFSGHLQAENKVQVWPQHDGAAHQQQVPIQHIERSEQDEAGVLQISAWHLSWSPRQSGPGKQEHTAHLHCQINVFLEPFFARNIWEKSHKQGRSAKSDSAGNVLACEQGEAFGYHSACCISGSGYTHQKGVQEAFTDQPPAVPGSGWA